MGEYISQSDSLVKLSLQVTEFFVLQMEQVNGDGVEPDHGR